MSVTFENPKSDPKTFFHLEKQFFKNQTSDYWDDLIESYRLNYLNHSLEAQMFLFNDADESMNTKSEQEIRSHLRYLKNEILFAKTMPYELFNQVRHTVIAQTLLDTPTTDVVESLQTT